LHAVARILTTQPRSHRQTFAFQRLGQPLAFGSMKFDDDGPWDLEVEGFAVLGMTFGPYCAEIIAYGPEGATSKIRLNGPFELHAPARRHERR
jgi:hypothetical protein